jgi:hypothetical protein
MAFWSEDGQGPKRFLDDTKLTDSSLFDELGWKNELRGVARKKDVVTNEGRSGLMEVCKRDPEVNLI